MTVAFCSETCPDSPCSLELRFGQIGGPDRPGIKRGTLTKSRTFLVVKGEILMYSAARP